MIIDKQVFFRAGVRQALSAQSGFRVLECDPTDEPLELIEANSPHIVLLDIGFPALNGLELGRKIVRRYPNSEVVMLSPNSNDEELFEVIKTGAVAYLNKNTTTEELISVIRQSSPSIMGGGVSATSGSLFVGLSAFAKLFLPDNLLT